MLSSARSSHNLGRFQRPPRPDEISLAPEEATRVATDLRRLASLATYVLCGQIEPPPGAPRLGGGAYYLKLALLVEGRLTISWREEAWLERALLAYQPVLESTTWTTTARADAASERGAQLSAPRQNVPPGAPGEGRGVTGAR